MSGILEAICGLLIFVILINSRVRLLAIYSTLPTIMRNTLLICIVILLSSCASVLNSRYKCVNVVPVNPVKVVYKGDTLNATNNSFFIPAERKKDPLEFEWVSNDTSKIIQVKSSNSLAYWLNLYPSTAWLGFLIDRKNPKRYTYPGWIYVNSSDSINDYTTYNPRGEKGKWKIQLSFPSFNSFLLKPEGLGYKSNKGVGGLSLGADYYYSQNKFLSLTVNGAIAAILVGDRWGGEYEDVASVYVGLANNYKIQNTTIGYGLSYGRNLWQWSNITEIPYSYDNIARVSYTLGFVFPVSYEFNKNFFIGAVYRPTFLQIGKTTHVDYEHFIGLEWGWRFTINK